MFTSFAFRCAALAYLKFALSFFSPIYWFSLPSVRLGCQFGSLLINLVEITLGLVRMGYL